MSRRFVALGFGVAFTALAVLGTAPLWATATGLGPRRLPEPGLRVTLPTGARVNVIDEGTGTPVLLVHGLPGSAYDWDPLPAMLTAAGFRVIRYDRVGYGHSDRRADGDSHGIDANARELIALASALHLDAPLVVGWSYGGGVAVRAAADSPSAFAGLVLLGTLGPATHMAAPPAFVEPIQQWGVAAVFPARLHIRRLAHAAFGDHVPAGWNEHALSLVSAPGAVHTWMSEARSADVTTLHANRVGVPVRLLHGAEDRISPVAVAADLQQRLRRSSLLVVPAAGHMLPNTHPAVVADALEQLRRAPG